MKTATVRQLCRAPAETMAKADQESVVITSNGRPRAVLIGVGNLDPGDLDFATSAAFWALIERRRAERRSGIPAAGMRRRLFRDE